MNRKKAIARLKPGTTAESSPAAEGRNIGRVNTSKKTGNYRVEIQELGGEFAPIERIAEG